MIYVDVMITTFDNFIRHSKSRKLRKVMLKLLLAINNVHAEVGVKIVA
jgi:hypothetical protein